MAAVIFCVGNEANTGEVPVFNGEVLEVAHANADVLSPSVSIDPHRGKRAVKEARRLIDKGAKGFKFHPSLQAFFPNDRMAYELYGVIEEAGLPGLFHTGHSGMGSGLPCGGGIRLGAALFTSAMQGITGMNARLAAASAQTTPDRALVVPTRHHCPPGGDPSSALNGGC
jgi:predicted TIM-barrel fold metal-dependent hydrolase